MTPTRKFAALALGPLVLVSLVNAQTPAPAAPAPPSVQTAADRNTQFMNQVMQTAAMVQGLIKTMNLEKAFGPGSVYPPGDPRSLQRTAEFMGVGAGVGMALGEMSHNQKGVLIGAAAGSAGGLIVDQLLRHQAEKASHAASDRNADSK